MFSPCRECGAKHAKIVIIYIVSAHRLSPPPPPRATSCSNPGPHALTISALPSPDLRLTGFT